MSVLGVVQRFLSVLVSPILVSFTEIPVWPKWSKKKKWWGIANGQNGCNYSYTWEKVVCVQICGKVQSLSPYDKHSWLSHLFLYEPLTPSLCKYFRKYLILNRSAVEKEAYFHYLTMWDRCNLFHCHWDRRSNSTGTINLFWVPQRCLFTQLIWIQVFWDGGFLF